MAWRARRGQERGRLRLAEKVRYSQSHCRRYAATARKPRQGRSRGKQNRVGNFELQLDVQPSEPTLGDAQRARPLLASANERSRHSGGNDSLSRTPPDRAKTCTLFPSPGCAQAISLGYFSLGQQREVTRAAAAVRKPAASEPDRQALSLGKVTKAPTDVRNPAANSKARRRRAKSPSTLP